MKEYGKIRQDGSIQIMTNPYSVTIANPTKEQKELLAELGGWKEVRYTEPPEHNIETQYAIDTFKIIDGIIVQVWELHDIPAEE